MLGLTPRRMAMECGGVLHVPEGFEALAETEVSMITTDSRKAREGCAFAAIPGSRVDGHDFIPDVISKGALCVIAEREPENPDGFIWIKVYSTVTALGSIARFYRENLGIPVVGITGSVGKTSTKEMVAAVLSERFRTLKTQGNYNNELGLPLTVFELNEEHEAAVLEMGISDFGEMHRLARIARPDICIMTNIGTCHLEQLGDRDGVLRAKSEIFDYLEGDGKIILNGNDDKLITIKEVNGIRPYYYGIPDEEHPAQGNEKWPRLDFYADGIRPLGLEGTQCIIHTPDGSFEVKVPVPGNHMVMNALAGAAAGFVMGIPDDLICEGIGNMERVKGRFNIIRTEKMTVVDDCYNANPMSMKASLDQLVYVNGPAVAVLGDMGELGSNEAAFHEEVGVHAAKSAIHKLFCIGTLSRHMAQAAENAKGSGVEVSWYPDVESFLEKGAAQIRPGETVLVKASHFMHFEQIVQALTEM